MLEAIEQDLVARLQAALPELHVEAFPDDPKRYRLQHPKGAVLVVYRAGSFSRPEATSAVVQTGQLEWEIHIILRQLHGQGVYAALDGARDALIGWRPTHCTPCFAVRDGFVSQGNGVWQYALRIATTRVVVEGTAEAELPLVTRIRLKDTHGEIALEIPEAAEP